MEKRLKSWQGWLLFGGSMVVVFVLGLCVSALMERRAELASVFPRNCYSLYYINNSLCSYKYNSKSVSKRLILYYN